MISVVMPVKNEERLVGRAIRSVLDQTHRDFEFVVVDNGSTDGTREVVARFVASDPRMRLVEEPRPGKDVVRNRGLAEARRPWIAVQDADDVSHPERLERMLDHVKRHPRTVAVGAWAVVYSEATGLRDPLYHATSNCAIRCQLRTGPAPFVHSSVLVRRDACLRVGGYPASFLHAEDYALFCLLQHEGRLGNLPVHLLVYRHQDRDPGSAFRATERASTEDVKRRLLRPATRLDEWVLRLTQRARRRRALERIATDWPEDLVRRYALEDVFARRTPVGSLA